MEVKSIGSNQVQRQNFTALQPLEIQTAKYIQAGLKKGSVKFAKKFADTFVNVTAKQKENKFFDIVIGSNVKSQYQLSGNANGLESLKDFSISLRNKVAILGEREGSIKLLASELGDVKQLRQALRTVNKYVTKQAKIIEQVKRLPVEGVPAGKTVSSGGGHIRA